MIHVYGKECVPSITRSTVCENFEIHGDMPHNLVVSRKFSSLA